MVDWSGFPRYRRTRMSRISGPRFNSILSLVSNHFQTFPKAINNKQIVFFSFQKLAFLASDFGKRCLFRVTEMIDFRLISGLTGSSTCHRAYTCGKDKMTNIQYWILKMKLEKFFVMRSRPNLQPGLEAQSCLLDFSSKTFLNIIILNSK